MISKKISWRLIPFIFITSEFCMICGTESVFSSQNHLIFKRNVCSANEFKCSDVVGTCVNKDELCDGKWNCKNGEDESYAVCRSNKCPEDKFRCSTGACIDRRYLCDGTKQCIFDEDDEKKNVCHNNTCPTDKYRCSSGACLDKNLLCNGYKDCFDGDDETIAVCQNNKCSEDKFRCSTGACFDKSLVCDGLKHCIYGGDDETPAACQNKNNTCPESKFRCSSGACVDRYWICNGFRDCVDGDDEAPALCHNNTKCSANSFRCASGACVHRNWLCNGFKDCYDGDDETPAVCKNNKCPADKFQCSSGACVNRDWLCNGFKDCFDGDDEKPEVCRNNTKCPADKFRCSSGACVNRNWLCNGFRDCADGDDESPAVCEDNKCPADKFQCSSGACVNKNWLCNGFRDCYDGDDEIHDVCQKNKIQPKNSTCALPQISADKTFSVHCPPKTSSQCSSEPGDRVPDFTQVTFDCKTGYQYQNGNSYVSSCFKGQWNPPISKCYRTCPPIKNQDMDLNCFQQLKGASIPCGGLMPEGAVVYPKCKDLYHKEIEVDYSYIQCQPNGQWNRELFKCIPDCGKIQGNIQGLIVGGKPERHGDSPWHAAIYDLSVSSGPQLICGGTIITSHIVVSAAHCFYNFADRKLYNTRNFEVVVGKYTQDYKIKDNSETKVFKIRKIFIPDEVVVFTGDSTSYAGDIALLWLSERIALGRGVLPACVDWTDTSRFVAPENAKGKLVGWGETEKRETSAVLLATLLPYISNKNCREMVSEDFANSIATDKFCAGTKKGPGAGPGDSGGGLLFRNTESYGGLYYLRGIVSNKDGTTGSKETFIAAFTDVAQYIGWIYEKRVQIENEELRAETKVGLKS